MHWQRDRKCADQCPKSSKVKIKDKIPVTKGQLHYEFEHLLKKIKNRDQDLYRKFKNLNDIEPNPLFNNVIGDIEDWGII